MKGRRICANLICSIMVSEHTTWYDQLSWLDAFGRCYDVTSQGDVVRTYRIDQDFGQMFS